jgi:uncharacterized protein YndB with AHSA1/START domain
MARNEISIDARPEVVFELLSQPRVYQRWVPGTRAILDADASWPAVGSTFRYAAGPRMVGIEDRTHVVSVLAPVMLELRIRARPLATARVTVHLQPEGTGTRLTLIEELAGRPLRLLMGPMGHLLVRVRNAEALRRLKALVEAPP